MPSQRQQKIIPALAGIIIGILLSIVVVRATVASIPEPAFHEHANFAMFINGNQFDFSKGEYMSIEPCVTSTDNNIWQWLTGPTTYAHGEETGTSESIAPAAIKDLVHLHGNIGSTIHAHQEEISYHDFFDSLNMNISATSFKDDQGFAYENDSENSWRFFLNNTEVEDITTMEVRDNDRALFTYGPVNRNADSINSELVQVPNDSCLASGTCTHRGQTPIEYCGSATQSSWLLNVFGIGDQH